MVLLVGTTATVGRRLKVARHQTSRIFTATQAADNRQILFMRLLQRFKRARSSYCPHLVSSIPCTGRPVQSFPEFGYRRLQWYTSQDQGVGKIQKDRGNKCRGWTIQNTTELFVVMLTTTFLLPVGRADWHILTEVLGKHTERYLQTSISNRLQHRATR